MKKIILLVSAIFLLAAVSSAAQVIILNETVEPIYSLDHARLSGDLEKNILQLSATGEVIQGENVRVYLFGPSEDILVKDLKVNGVEKTVSFDERGYFFIAQEGKLTLSANVMIRTLGQISLDVPGPLNELTFDLENGYAINGDRFGLYDDSVILQRSRKAAMLVDGNFAYTYAERNTFVYLINFKSFGTTLGRYTLDLPNGEQVTYVDGAMKWEQQGSTLLLDLQLSEAAVRINGVFNSNNLRVPLKDDRHHVLVESDPEKKITLSTLADEIDLSESTITPKYSNARAFIVSYGTPISVSVKGLDLLPSLSATVHSAVNKIAVTPQGSILSDTQYTYANTGLDYIEVDAPGTPLFASTSGGAVKLTSDDKLLLAFPKTNSGRFDILSFTTRNPLGPVALIDVPVAKTDLPITSAQTQIYLPADYFVVETFGAAGGSELPGVEAALLFLVVTGFLAIGLRKDKKFAGGYTLFSVGLFYFSAALFYIFVSVSLLMIVKKHMPESFQVKWVLAGALLVIAVLVFLAGVFIIGSFAFMEQPSVGVTSIDKNYAQVESLEADTVMRELQSIGSGSGAISVPVREGVLPVKMQIPNLGKTIKVNNHLVTKENQPALKVLVFAGYLKYLMYLVSVLAGSFAYRRYQANA